MVINSGVVDPDGSGCCSFTPVGAFLPLGALDGLAITLIRDELVPNTPPVASCVESVNPSGKNIPPAGSTTLPGSKGGKNDDGFYALFGQGDEDGTAPVFVSNASGSATFGPFPSGLRGQADGGARGGAEQQTDGRAEQRGGGAHQAGQRRLRVCRGRCGRLVAGGELPGAAASQVDVVARFDN